MKFLLQITFLTALVLGTTKGDQPDIRKDMVHFDQAFIPAWDYTRGGDIQKAKAAVFYLEFQWQKLRGKYQYALPDDSWQETFLRVNDWLGDVYYAIDGNCPQTAFNQLEYVRYELTQLREAYRIDYYLDHLFRFQDELNMLIEASNDEMLCLMDWDEFEVLSTAALEHWRVLMIRPFDAALYELDTEEERLFRTYQAGMEGALAAFQQTVESADREAIAEESAQLEEAFMPLLRLFGNFEASRTYYATR